MNRILNKFVKLAVLCIQLIGSLFFGSNKIMFYCPNATDDIIDEMKERMNFYLPNFDHNNINYIKNKYSLQIFSLNSMLLIGNSRIIELMFLYRKKTYYIDHFNCFKDGGQWLKLAFDNSSHKIDRKETKRIFFEHMERLKSLHLKKTYIFGTGPSLEKASEYDWSDGYRIVCNTIVRDAQLWKHINPHIIVAGDTIYHFGFTKFAKSFRNDLKIRLAESNTIFIYPEWAHPIVIRDLYEFKERLIPMPCRSYNDIINDFYCNFSLPALGNVLNILLLPIGCFLSKNIYLWGFDGRAPDDKLFWSNSSKHTYPEYMNELICAHPKYFEHFLSKEDPLKYVKEVHGDALDKSLSIAEKLGWRFEMMHFTWTETLQKRCINQELHQPAIKTCQYH